MSNTFTDDNGLFNGVVWFDGYQIQMEGVRFYADMKDGKVQTDTVRVDPADEDYFRQLNMKDCLENAAQYMDSDTDYLDTTAGVQIYWSDESLAEYQKKSGGPEVVSFG